MLDEEADKVRPKKTAGSFRRLVWAKQQKFYWLMNILFFPYGPSSWPLLISSL